MKQVVSSEKLPIKLWLDDMEPGAMEQAKNLANLPFAFKHIPIMPDSHLGYGMPIGSILATKGVIVPNAVGVDIGCGMCAMKTDLAHIGKDQLKRAMDLAKARIPVGFNRHDEPQNESYMPHTWEDLPIVKDHYTNATYQVGTLGGGNHFVEIQQGDDGCVWVMVHSGSRNLGFTVAKHYNKLAIMLNERYHSSVSTDSGLAFLPIETREAKDYISEMHYCIAFALANRKLMMVRMQEALMEVAGPFTSDAIINESHNFAAWENHFGQNVIVHRKGAMRAHEGEFGMIPGSQGTRSYIVRGLGNPESFKSCSHGAGRKMGRKQASRELDLATEVRKMDELGVLHNIETTKDLDEAPGAYKDINVVMGNQLDLAEIVVELTPLAVMKG